MEKDIVVTCRKVDVSIVEKAINEAKAEYESKLAATVDPKINSSSFVPDSRLVVCKHPIKIRQLNATLLQRWWSADVHVWRTHQLR
jgi:hypothetical protein